MRADARVSGAVRRGGQVETAFGDARARLLDTAYHREDAHTSLGGAGPTPRFVTFFAVGARARLTRTAGALTVHLGVPDIRRKHHLSTRVKPVFGEQSFAEVDAACAHPPKLGEITQPFQPTR